MYGVLYCNSGSIEQPFYLDQSLLYKTKEYCQYRSIQDKINIKIFCLFLFPVSWKRTLNIFINEKRNKKIAFYFRTELSRYPVSFILWRYNFSFFFRFEVSCIAQKIFDIVKLCKKKKTIYFIFKNKHTIQVIAVNSIPLCLHVNKHI